MIKQKKNENNRGSPLPNVVIEAPHNNIKRRFHLRDSVVFYVIYSSLYFFHYISDKIKLENEKFGKIKILSKKKW